MVVKHFPMAQARLAAAPGSFPRERARILPRRPSRVHPRLFGRGPVRSFTPVEPRRSALLDDVKLFATTFAAGFLFVSILIA